MGHDFNSFLERHEAQHVSRFNRWCLLVGDIGLLAGTLSVISPRSRHYTLRLTGLGLTTAVLGHLVDGTLPEAAWGLVRHPIWTVRGDARIARRLFS